MALLAPQEVTLAGTTPSYGAVAASDTFVPGDDVFLIVKNAGGSADVVAVATPVTYRGQAVADAGGSVPATTGVRWFGPFPAQDFADPATGLATVTHSFTTTVTCALVKATRR
jgi:hypothetical protein